MTARPISKEIKVDVKQYPILEWKWKVVALPPRGDARKADTDDEAAQIYVTFPASPPTLRSRIIGYIWDSTAAGRGLVPERRRSARCTSSWSGSGSADLGKWITERRNVLEDFKKIYGEEPDEPAGVITLSINSQNTGSRAESFFGESSSRSPDDRLRMSFALRSLARERAFALARIDPLFRSAGLLHALPKLDEDPVDGVDPEQPQPGDSISTMT